MLLSIELTSLDAAVMSALCADPQEWMQNAVRARIALKRAELVAAEAAARRANGEPPLDGEDPLVTAALARSGAGSSPAPIDLVAYASRRAGELRDGGVMIAGMRIKTDAESRGLIDGADALCQREPGAVIDFKAATGWVQLDAAMMRAVALAVGRWVQACYSAHRSVSEGIGSGAITRAAQIDAAFAALERPE